MCPAAGPEAGASGERGRKAAEPRASSPAGPGVKDPRGEQPGRTSGRQGEERAGLLGAGSRQHCCSVAAHGLAGSEGRALPAFLPCEATVEHQGETKAFSDTQGPGSVTLRHAVSRLPEDALWQSYARVRAEAWAAGERPFTWASQHLLRAPRTRGLSTAEFLLTVLGAGSPRPACQQGPWGLFPAIVGQLLAVSSWRGQEGSLWSPLRGMRAVSSGPSRLPQAPAPASIVVGLGFQEGTLGDTQSGRSSCRGQFAQAGRAGPGHSRVPRTEASGTLAEQCG